MEKSRDTIRDGNVVKNQIMLSDFGIRTDVDDPVEIGRKMLDGVYKR